MKELNDTNVEWRAPHTMYASTECMDFCAGMGSLTLYGRLFFLFPENEFVWMGRGSGMVSSCRFRLENNDIVLIAATGAIPRVKELKETAETLRCWCRGQLAPVK